MKKVTDYLKPNILIIFGALLFLYYLNFLSYKGEGLALGIFAVVISVFYLGVGIASVLIGGKFSASAKKGIEVLSVSLFAIFMFVYFLLTTINLAKYMGPTAWTIEILSMIASLALVTVYIASKLIGQPIFLRFAYLLSAFFVLALLLDLLFDGVGNSKVLGNIDVLLVVIYGVFAFYLFGSLDKAEDAPEQAKTDEVPEPEKAE
ncbi:MAG: hypothetical protein J5958_00640 [Clostridia bacterium]|nr:hypothetical protein [Clostridia bacterium]